MPIEHDPRYRVTKYDNRVGESRMMRCGVTATITEYYDRHDITVETSDGYTLYRRTYTDFTMGRIDPTRVAKRYKEKQKTIQ